MKKTPALGEKPYSFLVPEGLGGCSWTSAFPGPSINSLQIAGLLLQGNPRKGHEIYRKSHGEHMTCGSALRLLPFAHITAKFLELFPYLLLSMSPKQLSCVARLFPGPYLDTKSFGPLLYIIWVSRANRNFKPAKLRAPVTRSCTHVPRMERGRDVLD